MAAETDADKVVTQASEPAGPRADLPAIRAGEAFRSMIAADPATQAACKRVQALFLALSKLWANVIGSPEFETLEAAARQRLQAAFDAYREGVQAVGDELTARHFKQPESIEDWERIARIVEMPEETIRAGNLTLNDIFEAALAWADRQIIKAKLAATVSAPAGGAREKGDGGVPKSTRLEGERQSNATVKLVAALLKHHQYDGSSVLNCEPIGCNALAKLADVAASTASAFFNTKFGQVATSGERTNGHACYQASCRDQHRLTLQLKALNGDIAPHQLYGRRPSDEDGRDSD